jgi:hypothetical protein
MSNTTKLLMVGILAGLMAGTARTDYKGSIRFESGGASYEEVEALNQRAGDYSLKLVLAAKGSGAYLADVDVTITALPRRETVLQHRTEGPLLLVALPPGRYEVNARFEDVLPGAPDTVMRTLVVPHKGLVQAVLYFDTGDEVGS